jgi:hypothetical protein
MAGGTLKERSSRGKIPRNTGEPAVHPVVGRLEPQPVLFPPL